MLKNIMGKILSYENPCPLAGFFVYEMMSRLMVYGKVYFTKEVCKINPTCFACSNSRFINAIK